MTQQYTGVAATLNTIREQTAQLNQVAFVFQPWIEFNNLGPDGFLIPAVPMAKIPRLSLIPLVSIPQKHIESQKDITTNKIVPKISAYTQPIHSSYLDLVNRYGASGLCRLDPLTSTIENAIRYAELFEKVMQPFHERGLLEDLPEYFGSDSPVIDQFDTKANRLRMIATDKIDSLVKHMEMSEAEAGLFKQCLPYLAESARKAHIHALEPSNGILPQSITEINQQRKAKMDAVDVFIAKEFPSFNADNLLNHRRKQSSNDELADLLRQAIGGKSLAPTGPTEEEINARIEAGIKKHLDSLLNEPQARSGDSPEEEQLPAFDPYRCQGVNAKGFQCGLGPNPEAEYPDYCDAHQRQAAEKEIELADAATA